MKIILLFVLFLLQSSYLFSDNNFPERGSTSQVILIKDDNSFTPEFLTTKIRSLGYSTDVVLPEAVSLNLLSGYDLVVLSCGSNYLACRNSTMRLSLEQYILNEGKVIIEGGDNGYIAAV